MLITMSSMLKKVLCWLDRIVQRKKWKTTALDQLLREHCKWQDLYHPVAANVASSKTFAFNGPLEKEVSTFQTKDRFSLDSLESHQRKDSKRCSICNEQELRWTFRDFRSCGQADGLPSLLTWKRWHYEDVDRYTILVRNLKTLHKYYEAGYIPKT